MRTNARICRRCGNPLGAYAAKSKLWDHMHWSCFLIESELIVAVVIGATVALLIALALVLKYTIELPN